MPELLESRLADLAEAIDYPPTPDLAAAVRGRLAAVAPPPPAARRRHRAAPRRALLLAVVLALLGGGVAVAAVPALRHAVAEVLGLRGASVRRVARPPAAPAGRGSDLGPRVSLAAARRRAGFALVSAHDAVLGAPRAVHLAPAPGGGGRVTIVYADGSTLTELRGSTARDLVRKLTPPTTPIERLRVRNGEPGLWVDGPHAVMFADATGRVEADGARSAGRALLWQRGPLLLRLETGAGRSRALQIARSVR